MTQTAAPTATTTQAATIAQVTPRTIRRWAAAGRVTATKTTHGWAIDTISLHNHLVDRIVKLADFSCYVEKGRVRARIAVANLISDGALIPLIDGVYLAVSKTDANKTYVVNTIDQTCDCASCQNRSYCTHLTAAQAIEASKTRRAHHALAA